MAKEINYYGQLRPTGVDNSAVKRLQAVAGLADQVQDIAYQIGAKKAQREGEREGAIAGQKAAQDAESQRQAKEVADSLRDFNDVEGSGGQSTLTSSQAAAVAGQPLEKRAGILSAFSIKDNAYNDALESAYLSQVSVDSQEQMARIAAQYPDDVEAYSKAAAQVRAGITSSIDPNYQGVVGATLDNVIQSYETKVFGNQVAKGRALADESRLANIETLGNNAASFARNGDTEQAKFALLEAKTILDSMASERGESWVTEQYRLLVREVKEQEVKHGLANKLETEGRDAAFTSLSELENTGEFTADEFDAFKANAFTMLKRDQAIEEASREVASEQEAEMVKDHVTAVSLGVTVDPAVTEKVRQAAANDPDLLEQFNRANKVAAFSVESFGNRDKQLQEAEDAAENLENVEDYQALLTAQAQINSAVQKDPLAFADSQGLITLEPLDITDPEAFATRIQQSKTAAVHYGVSVPPMTDSEVSQVAASINQMTPEEKIVFANTLSAAPEMWGALAGKNQPVFAQAGAIGNVDTQLAVFTGQARIDNGLVKPPAREDYLPTFEKYVGDVYLTEDKASNMKAALAHYAGTQTPGEQFDSGLFEESLRAVAGNIQEVNGFKTVMPQGVNEDSFKTFVENIDAEYIESIGGASAPDAVDIIQNARLYASGENAYVVMVDGNQVLTKPDGSDLVISYEIDAAENASARNQARNEQAARQLLSTFRRGGGGLFSRKELEEGKLSTVDFKALEQSMSEPVFGDSESQPSQQGIGSAQEGTADRLRAGLQSLDGED